MQLLHDTCTRHRKGTMVWKELETYRQWSKDIGCRPFLAGALCVGVIVDGQMGKLMFESPLFLLVRQRSTSTTGKMWTYGHPTLSVRPDSVFSVVSSIRSVGHSAWTTSAVSYIFTPGYLCLAFLFRCIYIYIPPKVLIPCYVLPEISQEKILFFLSYVHSFLLLQLKKIIGSNMKKIIGNVIIVIKTIMFNINNNICFF